MTLNGDNKPNAKFGFSISSAGDLNQDGFNGKWQKERRSFK